MSILTFIKNLFSNNKINTKIFANNLTKTFGESDQLEVGLTDINGNPLSNKNVIIEINGVRYNCITDENGIARLNIRLRVGKYPAYVDFEGDDKYNPSSDYCKVFVNPLLTTQDMVMQEKDGSQFIAIVSSSTGVRLSGVPIVFTVNGINYERTSDMVGEAKLNINLPKGDYDITTSSLEIVKKNTIHIDEKSKKVTRMEGTNMSKSYSDKTAYQCAVYDDVGRVAGTVDITINGVTYTKTPDKNGLYKLDINLLPGTYQLTAKYRGDDTHLASQIVNTIHIVADPVKTVYNPIKIQYQPNSYTCGPTSLAMCSQILGKSTSISAFANACYTTGNGTSPANLIAGAKKLGFKVTEIPRNINGIKAAIDNGKPVIAHIMTGGVTCLGWQGNYGHYIVIYDYGTVYYYIADPTKGLGKCTHSMIDNAMRGYAGIKYYSVEKI